MGDELSPGWARAIGAMQVLGGGLEVAFGLGGLAAPTGVTQVGGIILVAHGSDTVVAGFRTLWHGQVAHSYTQQVGEGAARLAGASDGTARMVGTGVDIAAGIGPSVAVGVSRRVALAAAEEGAPRVAVAYLHRSAFEVGHNAVGVEVNGVRSWVHFAFTEAPMGQVGEMVGGPNARYVLTEVIVSGKSAARAIDVQQGLMGAGPQLWTWLGPNCTTTALDVLRGAGVMVPAWSRSPFLLSLGMRAGPEITFLGGTVGAGAPAFAPAPAADRPVLIQIP
jgi:hypothetical protein